MICSLIAFLILSPFVFWRLAVLKNKRKDNKDKQAQLTASKLFKLTKNKTKF